MNSAGNPSRKLSVPENFNKPPSPKESDMNIDPLTDKLKQSSTSSIKPPSTLQPPFVLQQPQQQQQQKGVTVVSQSKPSPPLANKRPTAIPRKPVATSTKNHAAVQSDFDYHQMDIPTSHFTEELLSLTVQHAELLSNDELLSPPMVGENQFSFTRYSSTSQQQVKNLCSST